MFEYIINLSQNLSRRFSVLMMNIAISFHHVGSNILLWTRNTFNRALGINAQAPAAEELAPAPAAEELAPAPAAIRRRRHRHNERCAHDQPLYCVAIEPQEQDGAAEQQEQRGRISFSMMLKVLFAATAITVGSVIFLAGRKTSDRNVLMSHPTMPVSSSFLAENIAPAYNKSTVLFSQKDDKKNIAHNNLQSFRP
jgi:hypothetical protein